MIKTDVVIVGAGPCGLFQVFELGLLGLKAEVVDSIRQPGGQCTELYPGKPIYDIPGITVCTGEELTASILKQIEPFSTGMHLGEEVVEVRPEGDEFYLATDTGKEFMAKAIVIAAGVGSFQPRALRALSSKRTKTIQRQEPCRAGWRRFSAGLGSGTRADRQANDAHSSP